VAHAGGRGTTIRHVCVEFLVRGNARENTFIRVQTRALPRCVYEVYIHRDVHGFNKE